MKYHAKEIGTKMHHFAKDAIELGIRMPTEEWSIYVYINDAIDFGMTPEVPLYYSENAFGTCDAIVFDEKDGVLRIHDLKTGHIKASMNQLYVYDALFCLEYRISPYDINTQNRIYQANCVSGVCPKPDLIRRIMDKIIIFDERIEKIKRGDI